MLLKQTKIVATISDQHCEVDFIRELFEAGMNVVRMNTAHAGHESLEKVIANVRTVSNRIAILMDTKGPEVRTTPLASDPIPFKVGDKVKVAGNPEQPTTCECISVSYSRFVNDVNVGGHILIDDGDLELIVTEKDDNYLYCEVQNEAIVGNRKSVNVPGVRINLPSLTEKDRNNILYAIEKNIDFIAHSFVRNKQDVLAIKAILDGHHSDIRIIAKIENEEGVDNIDEILEVADGIMVARGDLGIEVAQERIPAHPQVHLGQETGNCGYADVAHHDQQSPSYSCRGNRHRQRYLLPYRCPDAQWRNGLRQIPGRGRKDHDQDSRTGREGQAGRERHPHSVGRKQQRRDGFLSQTGCKGHYKTENTCYHYRQLQRSHGTQSGCLSR